MHAVQKLDRLYCYLERERIALSMDVCVWVSNEWAKFVEVIDTSVSIENSEFSCVCHRIESMKNVEGGKDNIPLTRSLAMSWTWCLESIIHSYDQTWIGATIQYVYQHPTEWKWCSPWTGWEQPQPLWQRAATTNCSWACWWISSIHEERKGGDIKVCVCYLLRLWYIVQHWISLFVPTCTLDISCIIYRAWNHPDDSFRKTTQDVSGRWWRTLLRGKKYVR